MNQSSEKNKLCKQIASLAADITFDPEESKNLSDPLKQQKAAKHRSNMAIKLLTARGLLEKLVPLAWDQNPEVLADSGQLIFAAYLKAKLPIEARAVFDRYIQNPALKFTLNKVSLRLAQLDLIKSFFENNMPLQAEEIFLTMDELDSDDGSESIGCFIYFLFILYYSSTFQLAKAGKIYNDFLALMTLKVRPGETARPQLTLVESSPLIQDNLPPDRNAQASDDQKAALKPDNPEIFNPLPLTLINGPAAAGPAPPAFPDFSGASSEDLLAMSAEKLADILIYFREYGRLEELYKTLDILPDTPENRLNRSNLILRILGNFHRNPAGQTAARYRYLAEKFYLIQGELADYPEMIACRARAIVCLLHIYFEDPKLKRAEELFASLLNLPEESASEEKLIGQNVMICTYFEHGKPLKAYDLCLKLTGDKDPQDCSLLLISSSLLTGIESLLRADCLKEVTKLFSVLASVKSPLVNLQKSRAAIAVLANLQRFDNILDWQIICQNIAQISDLPESLQPGFLKVLDNLITSLTKSQKLDFLELLDNELALWDLGQISHIRNLRAQIWLSLCEYFLAKGMEQKALLTAEKIRLLAEDPKFLPLKSKMELVLFKHYTANNDPQKNALFQSLKAPSKEQTAVLCLSQALIIRESEAAFTAPLEKLLALFSEQQTLTQKSYNFDKSTLLSQKLTMTVLLTALSLHNQDLCLAQAMGNDLITPQGWAKWPILAQKYSLMLADFLIDNDIQPNNLEIISQLAKINTPASMTAQGQIYLKLIKKLVSDHKLPQAAALVGQLAELCRQKPLIAVYAQGILAVIEGYVRAGLFLPKLKLSRPVRPTRHPLGSDSSQSGEAPAQDNALFWLMELLALPQKELTAVPCRKAVYSVVIGLIKNFQTTKALEIFALLPAPGEGSAYEEIKIYLNTFLYILNALSLKAVSATFDLVSGLLQSRLLNFVLKYYSSELTDILRILQNIDPQKCRLLAIIPEKFQPDRRQ